jgi:hypothetical protein
MAMDYTEGGILGNVGGYLGITDPNKGKRAIDAMSAGQRDASQQLDDDIAAQLGMLQEAGVGRSLGQNLDAYDTTMGGAQDMTQTAAGLALGQADAGSASDVFGNLNPMMDQILSKTKQQMQGTAGDALQSSAANRGTAQAVAGKAGDLWQQAFSNTMNRAQNNLNVAQNYGQAAGQTANLGAQQLNADNAPMEDWLNLKNDVAMQRYAGNVGLTEAQGAAAGVDQSLFGGLLGG